MTHAFFKSVLFLGAGNVMHAMHDELNIKKMGALGKEMKTTMIIMTIASLALAGIWPFAGFFSKDKILETAFASHHYILWAMLWIGAGMTAFYSFRLVMLVFTGKPRYKEIGAHPHEAKWYALAAMAPLAILAIIAGFFEHSFVHYVTEFLPEYEPHVSTGTFLFLLVVTLGIALSGIVFAVLKYRNNKLKDLFEGTPIHSLLANQYYIPHLYEKVISKPYYELSKIAWEKIDMKIVDATVDGIAAIIYKLGGKSTAMQSGNLSKNLKWMVVGLVVLLMFVVFYKPGM